MIFGAIIGALAVRTEGIYTIMITLAIAAAFFYFTNENYAIFNGHTGINGIPTPQFLGRRLARRDSLLLSRRSASRSCAAGRSPMSRGRRSGSRCRGSATIRAGWRRSASTSMRIASRPMCSPRFIAALGGVLLVWSYGEIAPGTVSVSAAIDILIIAVVGGIGNPIGPFIGALIYAVLKTFALDFLVAFGLDGNRFRLLIGLGFLAIVFFSPDGVIGLWARWRNRCAARPARAQPPGGGHG